MPNPVTLSSEPSSIGNDPLSHNIFVLRDPLQTITDIKTDKLFLITKQDILSKRHLAGGNTEALLFHSSTAY